MGDALVHSVAHVHAALQTPIFEELQDMETSPLQSCRACTQKSKDCPECSFQGGSLTLEELRSVEMMQKGMQLDSQRKVIRVSYPLRDKHQDQPNNYKQVRAVQSNIEAWIALLSPAY